jgi:hypothetical protein
MPTTGALNGKNVYMQIRDGGDPIKATVNAIEENGVWLTDARVLTARSGLMELMPDAMFFVPWTSIDWIAVRHFA